jgi:hypothetical protein
MKNTAKRFLALVLVFVAVLSFSIPAFADYDEDENRRASDYINCVSADIYVSMGSVYVYYSITGTSTMDSIGATDILVYNSHNSCVACLVSNTTPGLMGSNTAFFYNTINCCNYQSGEHYYAIVGYKAEKNGGYDTTSYMTGWT